MDAQILLKNWSKVVKITFMFKFFTYPVLKDTKSHIFTNLLTSKVMFIIAKIYLFLLQQIAYLLAKRLAQYWNKLNSVIKIKSFIILAVLR